MDEPQNLRPQIIQPVFFDPKGRRARVINLLIFFAALLLLFTSTVIAIGLSSGRNSEFPALRPTRTADQALDFRYLTTPEFQPAVQFARDRQVPPSAGKALRFAFFPADRSVGFYSLKKHAKDIDAVIPDWLKLRRAPDGFDLEVSDSSPAVVGWLRTHDKRVLIYPEVNSRLTSGEALDLLSNRKSRLRIIDSIVNYLVRNDFPGVVFDTRDLPESGFRTTAIFFGELKTGLAAAKRKLLLLVAPDIKLDQARTVATIADYVIAGTEVQNREDMNGAPAGQGWFEQRVRDLATTIPSAKLIVSVGSYCLDINLAGSPKFAPVQHCWDIQGSTGARLIFEGGSLNGSFSYHDDHGLPHKAWLLDGTTVFNQTKAALSAAPAGIALWQLGFEDPGAWRSLGRGRIPDSAALHVLESPHAGSGAFGVSGVAISARPGHVGKRSLAYNAGLGLIVDEHMDRLPSEAEISSSAAQGAKVVALTFDDGPDPDYTGPILDILARKGVKATFYNIGANVLTAPELVRREYLEGHDIGNHTFSHRDPTKLSAAQLALELNATSRILRSITGAQTHLFRPPYAGPSFDYLDAKPEVAFVATRLGYIIGGLGVETCDYCGVGPQWIVSSAIDGVVNQHDHVILLHDGGQNHSATVAALPELIDELRNAGYRFVTTHELIGSTRAAVMQPMPPHGIPSDIQASVWRFSIAAFQGVTNTLPAWRSPPPSSASCESPSSRSWRSSSRVAAAENRARPPIVAR
jgi:peptidoglycan/xylan/chitin deacetylase (PgdA/CDA1 family)